jgi:uncharacterized membrane protein YfcA
MSGFETVFDSLAQFLVVSALLALAQTIYVAFGFGVGLIAVGTLAIVLPEIRDVVVLLLFVSLPAELHVVGAARRDISWRQVLLICAGILAGVPVGTWALRHGEPTFLLLLLGLVLVGAGAAFLSVPARRVLRAPRWVEPPLGLVSGVLAGLFGTGGPPLILYYQLGGLDKARFRRSLMAIFLFVTVVRLPAYVVSGLITVPRLWSGLLVLPASALGLWLGHHIHIQLSELAFKRLVSIALILIGALLLARQLV